MEPEQILVTRSLSNNGVEQSVESNTVVHGWPHLALEGQWPRGSRLSMVAVSEAVVGVEGEGRDLAAVTAVLGRDPAAVTAGMVTNAFIIVATFNLLSIKAINLLACTGSDTGSFIDRF